jgi:hypothetical protein
LGFSVFQPVRWRSGARPDIDAPALGTELDQRVVQPFDDQFKWVGYVMEDPAVLP